MLCQRVTKMWILLQTTYFVACKLVQDRCSFIFIIIFGIGIHLRIILGVKVENVEQVSEIEMKPYKHKL